MKLTRKSVAWLLLAAGGALLWWRSRAKAPVADGLTPDVLSQYKEIVTAFKPSAPTIIERTTADAVPFIIAGPEAAEAYKVEIKTADGVFSFMRPSTPYGRQFYPNFYHP